VLNYRVRKGVQGMATALVPPPAEYTRVFNAPSYPTAEAARLVGLSKGRVNRWIKGYDFSYQTQSRPRIRYSHKDPIVTDKDSRFLTYVSFIDLIELLLIREFLNQGINLPEIRSIFDEVRNRKHVEHLAYENFFTLGKSVFWEIANGLLMKLASGGQLGLAQLITKLGHQIEFDEATKLALQWYPMHPDRTVVIDPRVSFGHPVIAGRRITTAALFDLYNAENKDTDRVCEWMNIKAAQLESAIKFENQLIA
jgi:uncharacterized protein (DUF433 family)